MGSEIHDATHDCDEDCDDCCAYVQYGVDQYRRGDKQGRYEEREAAVKRAIEACECGTTDGCVKIGYTFHEPKESISAGCARFVRAIRGGADAE